MVSLESRFSMIRITDILLGTMENVSKSHAARSRKTTNTLVLSVTGV